MIFTLTPVDLIILLLFSFVTILSWLAIVHPNVIYAIFFLFVLNVMVAIIFFMLGAPFVALVQLAVFSGAIVVLFLLAAMLTRGGVWK